MFFEEWKDQNSYWSNLKTTNQFLSHSVPACWCPITTGSVRTFSRWAATPRGEAAAREWRRTGGEHPEALQKIPGLYFPSDSDLVVWLSVCIVPTISNCFTGVCSSIGISQVRHHWSQPQWCFLYSPQKKFGHLRINPIIKLYLKKCVRIWKKLPFSNINSLMLYPGGQLK